jgi:hypothetical protein
MHAYRRSACALLAVPCLVLGCASDPPMIEGLRGRVATLESERVESRAREETLTRKVENLDRHLDELVRAQTQVQVGLADLRESSSRRWDDLLFRRKRDLRDRIECLDAERHSLARRLGEWDEAMVLAPEGTR